MFSLTSCRIFAASLLIFFFVSGCVESDPAKFPNLADFPKEPIIVPSPEAQKQQQAILRAAYNQGDISLAHPGMPNILVETTSSYWLQQSEEIVQRILPILTSEPDIPVMVYITGTKPNHNNMLALGVRVEDDLVKCGINPDRLIIVIGFCDIPQDIQIQLAFTNLGNNIPLEVEELEIEEEEISDDIQDGS